MLTGTNSERTKAFNHRIVLETIRLHAPLSRAEIARRTALTPQTISNIVTALLDEGLVYEVGKQKQGQGAPSISLDINPEGTYSVGLDLDRDHLTGILTDLNGRVRQRLHHELSYPDPDEAVQLMVRTGRTLLARESLSPGDASGIGVGFPGPIEVSTENETPSVHPKAFPGWNDVPLVALLQEHVDLPIFLENNATAAAVGERWYGAGRETSTFFYLLLGVGLGGGLIVDGHPYKGHSGNAGELGYVPVAGGAPFSSKTSPNHLGEHYHLPRLYEQLRAEGIDVRTPADLTAPFKNDSPVILNWLDTLAQRLAPVLVSLECLLDPATVVFGGRLPDVLIEALLSRLRTQLPRLRTEGFRIDTTLQPASAGTDAAALGVATLPIYNLFAPAPRLLFKKSSLP